MKRLLLIIMGLACFGLVGCHHKVPPPQPQVLSWSEAMKLKMAQDGDKSRKQLAPYFARADIPYPPSELALLVFKNTKRMEVWAKKTPDSSWTYIRHYSVLAASGGPGPKLHEGDHQVPEGVYHIVGLNPLSRFDLSMQLDYPNAFDTAEAQQSGRGNLGSSIYIHGNKLSVGCIAIGDKSIEQLFPLVDFTGIKHVTVIIAPNDLRRAPPITVASDPAWVPSLYQHISTALNDFPLSKKQAPVLVAKNNTNSAISMPVPQTTTNVATNSANSSSSSQTINQTVNKVNAVAKGNSSAPTTGPATTASTKMAEVEPPALKNIK